ncbi:MULTISPECIES: response regulator [unclassified Paenibacillus]|uniref:response regulator transcription factor n=1 Tax=unclassified Paenibacillus TaxID=185978 RepID=UPI001047F0D2|nr:MULTISPECIES: response regulator [unclassified Paenibacillus]NIK66884.1 two-component system response regulator YesN [Paenibacillus sp. BK720]TCN00926.1 two-component system response regulator YesN [Paenibacillus sp. BK033]
MNGKVLLVDDEPHITRNLEKVIPWEMLGLTVGGTAKNGMEALELLESESFDLVLCDIRMPVMDGLELVRHIREKGTESDIIMLSGYQDFAYTRAAIQYGVKDYVLKPIPYDELTGVIARVMANQRQKKKQQSEEQQKIGRMIDLASEKVLYDILMDYTEVTSGNWLFNGEEQELDKKYVLIVLDLDVSSERTKDWREWSDKERKLWNFAVCNVLRERLQQNGLHHAVIQIRDGEWCVLIECEKTLPYNLKQITLWTELLLTAVKNHVKLSLYAGIYRDYADIKALSQAYKMVQQGMQLTPVQEQICVYPNDCAGASREDQAFWDTSEKLIGAVKRGDTSVVDEELKHLTAQLQMMNETSLGRFKPMLHFFVLNLMRETKEMGIFSREQEDLLWLKLDRRFGIKDLLSVILQVTKAVAEKSTDKKKQSERSMAEAKAFLGRNLYRDLSVEEAATHVGLSTSYFSLLFKQTYNETFIEYVTRERMEKAKSLLADTMKSIAQIAKEVGYAERRYFTKVFMKYTGENPTDYRSRHQQVQEERES